MSAILAMRSGRSCASRAWRRVAHNERCVKPLRRARQSPTGGPAEGVDPLKFVGPCRPGAALARAPVVPAEETLPLPVPAGGSLRWCTAATTLEHSLQSSARYWGSRTSGRTLGSFVSGPRGLWLTNHGRLVVAGQGNASRCVPSVACFPGPWRRFVRSSSSGLSPVLAARGVFRWPPMIGPGSARAPAHRVRIDRCFWRSGRSEIWLRAI